MRALAPLLAAVMVGSPALARPGHARGESSPLPELFFGVQNGGGAASLLPELGVEWVRTYIAWNRLQPVVTQPDLTLEQVLTDDTYVDAFIAGADWSGLDAEYRGLVGAGLRPFPVVGAGWYNSYATLDGLPATPDEIGKDCYLAHMYVHVRAIVERYDGDGIQDADGIVIHTWQIENELNQAFLTALWGWRYPAFTEAFGSAWYDWDFLTELLITLQLAVKDADPAAFTVQNFHTDIPEEVNHMFRLPSWEEAVDLWRDHMDGIGFDAYPNYYYAEPIHGEVIGERVARLYQLGLGKPVLAMEVGYPSGPAEMGYSQEKQSQFLEEAMRSAAAAGVRGYFHFKLESAETHDVVITEEDQQIVAALGHAFENGHVVACSVWALANLTYVEEHLLDVLQAVEGYWGLVTPTGEAKPSFYTYQALVEELSAPAAAVAPAHSSK